MPSDSFVSVIIPTFNEAELLSETLRSIGLNTQPKEILVVDGNSTDSTLVVAKRDGARALRAPVRQRGAQMNFGAAQAQGDVLFFLHADTRIPPNALALIATTMAHPHAVGGAFARRYDHPSRFLKITCLLATWRSRLFGWNLGDQGIFVKKSVFEKLGGFPEYDQFEDLEFSLRLARVGKVMTLSPPVISSGRRFGTKPIRRTIEDLLLTWKYLAKDRIHTRAEKSVAEIHR